jgi:hypothetical protein
MSDRRGDYFDASRLHTYAVTRIPLYKTHSVELWIRPYATDVTITSFEIAHNFVFADFWISDCNSLVLDWGWTRV